MGDSVSVGDINDFIGCVEAHLKEECILVGGLDNDQLLSYKAVAGWRVNLEVSGGFCSARLILDDKYPKSVPELYLEGDDKTLVWPHVEVGNKLCVFPTTTTFDFGNPAGVLKYLISEAASLLGDVARGERGNDFITEFHSYWGMTVSDGCPSLWSTVEINDEPRAVACWLGKSFTLVAETREDLVSWWKNYFKSTDSPGASDDALYIPLNSPLLPSDYPKNNRNVFRIAKMSGHNILLKKFIAEHSPPWYVIFGFDTGVGKTIAGVKLNKPAGPKKGARDTLTKGFRPGKVPSNIIATRSLNSQGVVSKLSSKRIDGDWIHTRGGDTRVAAKKVCVIGCGSLGAQVAHLLAQSGVDLLLVDDDVLMWENVGRHYLGGSGNILRLKAESLKKQLLEKYPHLNIVSETVKWQDLWPSKKHMITDTDVVVSTTGDWTCDSSLNELMRGSVYFPKVVFGWLEARALAAHALIVSDAGGCLACGMSLTGEFTDTVIEWVEPQVARIPECGGHYQPYGPVDLSYAHALVSRAVLDVLYGKISSSQHRVWVGSVHDIDVGGGRLSNLWRDERGLEGGLQEIRRDWNVTSLCDVCNP